MRKQAFILFSFHALELLILFLFFLDIWLQWMLWYYKYLISTKQLNDFKKDDKLFRNHTYISILSLPFFLLS